jgi:mannose-6-phosphate isomerase-like protein (cupin superfamily)
MVRIDADRHDERHDLGIGVMTFRVTALDSQGALVAAEIAHHVKGGPPRHLHHGQDEWFLVIEGTYAVEVAGELFTLRAGDSITPPS